MRGIISTLLLAAAAMLFTAQGASAAWKCVAYGNNGVYGWGTADDKGAAGVVAMLNCAARGGGCRITGCEGSDPVRPTAPTACPPGQQRGENGKCNEAYKKCPNGEQIPASRNCPAVVQYKNCPNGKRIPVSESCPAVVQYKNCPDGQRIPVSERCPAVVQFKECPNGKRVPVSARCPAIVDTAPPAPPPRQASASCDMRFGEAFPSAGDLPRSIYEIKIGKTSLYAGGYPDIAANRNDCKGVTANGCYLRVVNVPRASGGSSEACVQFCKTELCPKIARRPDPAPLPPPAHGGKPATLTLIAPPYVAPQSRGRPAVPTLIAAPYVQPVTKGKPPVPTVSAAPYVVPPAKR